MARSPRKRRRKQETVGKRGDAILAGTPIFPANSGQPYWKLSPIFALRKSAFLEDPYQRPQIEANWQFIYQEPLFTESAVESEQELAEQISKRKKKHTRKGNGKNEKA